MLKVCSPSPCCDALIYGSPNCGHIAAFPRSQRIKVYTRFSKMQEKNSYYFHNRATLQDKKFSRVNPQVANTGLFVRVKPGTFNRYQYK